MWNERPGSWCGTENKNKSKKPQAPNSRWLCPSGAGLSFFLCCSNCVNVEYIVSYCASKPTHITYSLLFWLAVWNRVCFTKEIIAVALLG